MAGVRAQSVGQSRQSPMALDRGTTRHLVGADDGQGGVDLHVNELVPGGGLGHYHYHARADNVYVVLEGTMEAVVDGRRYVLPRDSCLFIPAGTPHAAGNAGRETARVLEAYVPAGEDFHVLPPPDSVVDDETGEAVVSRFAAP